LLLLLLPDSLFTTQKKKREGTSVLAESLFLEDLVGPKWAVLLFSSPVLLKRAFIGPITMICLLYL
jgi:hypothetical protein